MYAFIRTMVFDPHDARDILQNVNVIIYRKREAFSLGSNFKAWAFTIARFECLTYLNDYKKTRNSATLDTGLLESLADIIEDDDEDENDIKHWLKALKSCLLLLPDNSQTLILLRYKQGLSVEDTAQQNQSSLPAMKQKLYRIRNRLRKCILEKIEQNPPPE
jgi:RNA polymerase sigma-70 factor (ECF subfamily)